MLIVSYDEKYRNDIVAIVGNFYAEALKEYSAPIDPTVLLQVIEQHKDNTFLLIIDGQCEGVLAGITTTNPLNGDKVYQEICWYVNAPHRIKGVMFLKKVEQMLKEQGFTQFIMCLLHNSKSEKIARLYERMEFKPFETHYLKNL